MYIIIVLLLVYYFASFYVRQKVSCTFVPIAPDPGDTIVKHLYKPHTIQLFANFTLKFVQQSSITRMWTNIQRDGRPAEYMWRPLFNAAKFGWRPILECRAVMLPRRETRWNLQGFPKVTKGSQPLEGRSSPYCKDSWRRYCCLTLFSDCRYVPQLRRYSPTKLCDGARMAIFSDFICVLYLQRASCSTFQTCILNSH